MPKEQENNFQREGVKKMMKIVAKELENAKGTEMERKRNVKIT